MFHLNHECRLRKGEEQIDFHQSVLVVLKDLQARLTVMNDSTVIPIYDFRRQNRLVGGLIGYGQTYASGC